MLFRAVAELGPNREGGATSWRDGDLVRRNPDFWEIPKSVTGYRPKKKKAFFCERSLQPGLALRSAEAGGTERRPHGVPRGTRRRAVVVRLRQTNSSTRG